MKKEKALLVPVSTKRITQIVNQPRSQGSLLPALWSERERDPGLSPSRSIGRVGENPGNEVDRERGN